MKDKILDILISVLAVVIALVIGAGVIAYLGKDPIEAYSYLFQGAFASKVAIAQTLLMATPLIFTGLAVAFAFRGGLFNIGAQGQIIIGGLAAVSIAAFVKTPIINNIFVVIIVAALAGFIWAGIAGWLKAKLGINEVISTIMLNYMAISIKQYLINYPFKDGGPTGPSPQTPRVMEWVRLPMLMEDTRVPLNAGFIIAIIAAIVIAYILNKTILGYEIKAVGFNQTASENAGINVAWKVILAIGISGALAGLAGAERVLGGIADFRYQEGVMAEYGFDGIAVALLGKNNPYGIVIAAILFGALRAGTMDMQMFANVPSQITTIIQAIIIILIAAENIFRYFGGSISKMFSRKKVNA